MSNSVTIKTATHALVSRLEVVQILPEQLKIKRTYRNPISTAGVTKVYIAD